MSFTFGSTTTTTNATPFSFGPKTTASISFSNPASTASAGFGFGLTKTTASTGLLATPASTAAASTGSFGFGTGSSLLGSGLPLGGAAATTSGGFGGFGLTKTTAATTTSSSFGFGTGLGSSLLGSAPATTTTGLGGGLFGTSSAPSNTAGSSIFSSQPAKSSFVGLGGVDPNAGLKSGASGTSSSDGRTLKETILPEPLTATVEALQKYVKEEKAVREDIARMSSKPMLKVQEDVMALRQLLSVVANGLQRNTCSVEKLKQEMTQNLKNAEMAQRTKDLPAGLQYENTAPTEYFQRLVKEFEDSMVMYRQQIETLDNHLAALHHPRPHSPAEVLSLMKKLHETFLSLAAQLQQVHDAVKVQKDQFLTYRRVFHGDNKDIFQKTPVTQKPVRKKQLPDLAGPDPFLGVSNAATQAMAMVHNRSQQPQGPPATGLAGVGQLGSSPFTSGGLFGANKPIAGFGTPQAGGIGGSGSLFSSTFGASPSVAGFGTPPTLGSSTTAALNLAGTNLNMPAAPKQPFQLQKPPSGAKRGKR